MQELGARVCTCVCVRLGVRGRARAAEDVDDDEVAAAGEAAGELRERLARIPVAHADRGARRQRQLGAHEVDELALEGRPA